MKRRTFLKRAAAGVAATSLEVRARGDVVLEQDHAGRAAGSQSAWDVRRRPGAVEAHDHELAQEHGHDLRLG